MGREGNHVSVWILRGRGWGVLGVGMLRERERKLEVANQ